MLQKFFKAFLFCSFNFFSIRKFLTQTKHGERKKIWRIPYFHFLHFLSNSERKTSDLEQAKKKFKESKKRGERRIKEKLFNEEESKGEKQQQQKFFSLTIFILFSSCYPRKKRKIFSLLFFFLFFRFSSFIVDTTT